MYIFFYNHLVFVALYRQGAQEWKDDTLLSTTKYFSKWVHRDVILCASFEFFTPVKIQVEIFMVVTPCSFVVGYQRFRGSWCLHPENEENMYVWNVGILPQYYTASQSIRPQLEISYFVSLNFHLLQV